MLKNKRVDAGLLGVMGLLWVPACLIIAVLVGGKAAANWGVMMAAAPFLLGIAFVWACLVIALRTPEHFAVALIFGIPLVFWMLGAQLGAAALGASVMLWVGSRVAIHAIERRRVTQRAPGASYSGGLLIEPRHPRQDPQAHR
ncbi:hypothetical protein ACH0CP_12695 [Sphingomonas sp. 179-I 2A4 NHS]|uniref:hypothetical protein n=1 Tax=unclassified Sphingomonas TaxID=196159 RepID=UPI0038792711